MGDSVEEWRLSAYASSQRDMADLAQREAHYRERLTILHELDENLRLCSEAINRALRERPPSERNLPQTFATIALVISERLDIERTSVWLLDPLTEKMRCRALFVEGIERACAESTLDVHDSEAYLSALRGPFPVAICDARTDPLTLHLRDYVEQNQIGAMLDIAVHARGEVMGVVCLEHVGGPRTWRPAEISFASQLAALISLTIETERRVRAECAAEEATARHRYLVESLPVVVYSADADLKRIRYVSPQIQDIGGHSAEMWSRLGASEWVKHIVAEDRHLVRDRARKDLGHTFPDELIYRVRVDGDDSVRWIRDTCTLVRDAQGHPLVLQGILADITAQREAELAHAEIERRVCELLCNLEMLAVYVDLEGRVTEVNPHFREASGFDDEDVIGKPWLEFTATPEDSARMTQGFAHALRTGSMLPRLEYAIRTKTGHVRHLLWTQTLIRDTGGNIRGAITLGMDLTDRLRIEGELFQQGKAQSLGFLASSVAHDFNNLLTVIINQVSMLGRFAEGERADKAKVSLEAALSQATRLTQSLLVYARKTPETKQVTDFDALIQELAPLIHAMAGKQIRLTLALHAAPCQIWIHRTHLRQLVLNLVGNAAHATEGNGSHIRLKTHVEFVDQDKAAQYHVGEGGEFVVLTIEDDGRGMDKETMAKMFEPFFTTRDEGKGTGLGLAMCQSVAEVAGGFIEVESEIGRGTSIRVFFPRRTHASARSRLPPTSEVTRATRVMLAMDQATEQELSTTVRDGGYATVFVHTLSDAQQALRNGPIDVLVVSPDLGELSPILEQARARNSDMRVILLVHSRSKQPNYAFDMRLHLPLRAKDLLQGIDTVLQREKPSSRPQKGNAV